MTTWLLFSLSANANAQTDPILEIMQTEMSRSFEWLQDQEQPPYWIELAVTDEQVTRIEASNGTLLEQEDDFERILDLDLRVGDWTLDNTHPIIDGGYFSDDPTHFDGDLPLGDDPDVLAHEIWKQMDVAYQTGVRRLIKIQSNREIKVEREDMSDDFSKTAPLEYLDDVPDFQSLQQSPWTDTLRNCSADFLQNSDVLFSKVTLERTLETRRIVTTDGSTIREVRPHVRLSVYAQGVAEDGMRLTTYDYIDAESMDSLNQEDCTQLVNTASNTLSELLVAPVVDPFVGPAILRGKAAAVFFHEILGHRVEGHRQKDEDEGQTLTDKIDEQIFPDFIQVLDDPTRQQFNGVDLNGHYHVDDDGVLSQPVNVVENGVLKNFLMGRSPVEGFPVSNGHGRRQTGYGTVARQGNLMVSSSESKSYDDLKSQLIEEIKRQNKPFGLIFDDISGGFTFTGRTTPNSYVVKPVTVWRVYPDGREEMVRGVDMIGTPLLTFSRIVAASDEYQVFNGMCGAESGWVPVSAIAPDLLVNEVEIQRRDKSHDKPPLLSPPSQEEAP
jgi:predicted Zn-dependent protease